MTTTSGLPGLERPVRRLARREGYTVRKYRRRDVHPDDKGFALIDCRTGILMYGWDYDATLQEIEQWLQG